jgi:hypothetical protein
MVHFRKIAFLSKSGDYPTSEYFSKVMVTAKLCDIRRERNFLSTCKRFVSRGLHNAQMFDMPPAKITGRQT